VGAFYSAELAAAAATVFIAAATGTAATLGAING